MEKILPPTKAKAPHGECRRCAYWDDEVNGLQLDMGLCRRFPPTIQIIPTKLGGPLQQAVTQLMPHVNHPIVGGGQWCGEWKGFGGIGLLNG